MGCWLELKPIDMDHYNKTKEVRCGKTIGVCVQGPAIVKDVFLAGPLYESQKTWVVEIAMGGFGRMHFAGSRKEIMGKIRQAQR